ncbi:MAG: tRNA (adenosine(37)-N6)-threonylcarbamoyltransferase complex ATPase subunit type 1 TsaE [Candidatus Aquirickettsiella sp.]
MLLKTEKETAQLAQKFAACCPNNKRLIIFFNGELGAGKTFFVRSFVKSLGYSGLVKSPTYTLMEIYEIAPYSIYHLDLYRLQTANEILDMGLCDEFEHAAIWLIEWADRATNFLPNPDIVCHINLIGTNRQIQFFAQSHQGEQTLNLFNRYCNT